MDKALCAKDCAEGNEGEEWEAMVDVTLDILEENGAKFDWQAAYGLAVFGEDEE